MSGRVMMIMASGSSEGWWLLHNKKPAEAFRGPAGHRLQTGVRSVARASPATAREGIAVVIKGDGIKLGRGHRSARIGTVLRFVKNESGRASTNTHDASADEACLGMSIPVTLVRTSALVLMMAHPLHAQSRARARDLGVAPGIFKTGANNAITDVAGVKGGHATIISGGSIHTGGTPPPPHGGNPFQDRA